MLRVTHYLKFYFIPLFFGMVFLSSCSAETNPQSGVEEGVVEPLHFAAFGDWGSGSADQMAVANELQQYCESNVCDFVLTLGDNFYNAGVTSVTDPLFHDYFGVPYEAMDTDFYMIAGNHDANGNLQAQIDYSAINTHWIFPDLYYSHVHSLENGTSIEFFALNSNNLDPAQLAWLAQALDDSSAEWKIVYLHHPLYSNGNAGDDHSISDALSPILCGKVDLILAGHDHDKEHLIGQTGECEFHQVVLGTGGSSFRDVNPDSRSLYAVSSFGFGWFSLDEDGLLMRFIDTNGDVEYSYQFTKAN